LVTVIDSNVYLCHVCFIAGCATAITEAGDLMNHATAASVFTGLVPERLPATASGQAKSMNSTVPILIVGTMAVLNLSPAVAEPAAASSLRPNALTNTVGAAATVRSLATKPAVAAPAIYRVVRGDSVSAIAARFGLSTASVLAMNGLSRTSLVFPGQVLKLVAGPPVTATAPPAPATAAASPKYTVVAGDTVSKIARRFGVSTASVLSANGLRSSSIIRPGQVLRIPGVATAPTLSIVPVSAVTPVAAAPVPAPAPAGAAYVVRSGDTVSAIASAFGVSTQSILDANGLTAASIIYAGATLRIPGATTTGTTAAPQGVTALNDQQAAEAFTIIGVGRELGVSDYGIVIALATAMQESSMRNLNYGHLDSVGLFQQRPSSGWGTVAQLTTQSHAARLFFGGPKNPNKGKTRGLLDIAGWQSMTVTQAAQKVQISAYPDAYAKWEASARFWLSQLG